MLAGIFKRAEVREQATTWGAWPGEAVMVPGNVRVDAESSMQLLTVYGCVRLITDSISTLPVDAYRRTGEDAKEEIAKPLWLSQPTVDLDFTSWCTQVLTSLLLHGNAYIAVMRSEGRIVELVPLDPTKVLVRRDRGRKVYIIAGMPYTGEILHLKGLMMPGSDVGLSPIEYARQSIGLGLASVKFGAQFFEGEGNMPGVIEMPGRAQPETMKAIADSWRRRRREGGRGLPGVLQEGATWKPTGVTNEQAQFLATRQFTAAEIAGQMFMVDPTELGIGVQGQSLTYANLEQRNARFVRVTLLPWIVRLERALASLMMNDSYVKLNVDGLLRGDSLARAQSYELLAGIGVLTVDEIRDLEEKPPLSAEDRKQSRAWQEVGLPALVSGGLMTTNEARLQLGLPPIPGGDTVVVAPDPTATEAARMAVFDAETRATTRTSDTHIHLPDSLQVEMRQEPIIIPAPVVNVPPAQVTVNVEPTPVTVNVPPAEVTVNVPPSEVTVNVPPPAKPLVESVEFERDSSGKITGAKKRTI
jgi:HK97 family phage portal protein